MSDTPERMAADVAKIKAETELLEAQNRKSRAELDAKLQIEVARVVAETTKISAETRRLNRETFWYPLGLGAVGFAGAGTAFLGLVKLWEVLRL